MNIIGPNIVVPSAAIILAVTAGVVATGRHGLSLRTGEYEVDGKVYGMPEAVVFSDDYAGPPVVGEYVTHLPNIAPLPAGNRTHDVRVDIVGQQIEVAPGVRYQAWTFGGSVPGPVLHVREGDRVTFTMKNRSQQRVNVTEPSPGSSPYLAQLAATNQQKALASPAPMHHSIDIHAATVAPDDKWRMIQPGESIRFQWVANYPGVYLYHCGVPPVLAHVAMGQYGVVVVSPRDGYPTDADVKREYVVVQSEFYLKPGDEGLHVLDFDAASRKVPSQVVFNGHLSALTDHPLEARAGERIRLYDSLRSSCSTMQVAAAPYSNRTHSASTTTERSWSTGMCFSGFRSRPPIRTRCSESDGRYRIGERRLEFVSSQTPHCAEMHHIFAAFRLRSAGESP